MFVFFYILFIQMKSSRTQGMKKIISFVDFILKLKRTKNNLYRIIVFFFFFFIIYAKTELYYCWRRGVCGGKGGIYVLIKIIYYFKNIHKRNKEPKLYNVNVLYVYLECVIFDLSMCVCLYVEYFFIKVFVIRFLTISTNVLFVN